MTNPITGRCKDCKWWQLPSSIASNRKSDFFFGTCSKISNTLLATEDQEGRLASAVAPDGWQRGRLDTRAEFGCVLFDPFLGEEAAEETAGEAAEHSAQSGE